MKWCSDGSQLISGKGLKALKENTILHYHQGASMKYIGEVNFLNRQSWINIFLFYNMIPLATSSFRLLRNVMCCHWALMDSLEKISGFLFPSDYFFLLSQHLGAASCYTLVDCSTFRVPVQFRWSFCRYMAIRGQLQTDCA